MTPRQVKKPAQSAFVVMAATILASLLFMSIEPPTGLSVAGQRVLGVAVIAIGLWGTELLPMGVTSMLTVVLLMFSRGVETLGDALVGFAQPVPYFLIAVLTIGLAVQKCGLAERIARFFLRQCRGRPRALYAHLLLAFPLLTLLLPSATVRTGILVHVYEQALSLSQVPKESALSKAIMMALNSINRLASTAILTGGITPVVAAALIGGMSWSRWLVMMLIPYLALLLIGAGLIFVIYKKGFALHMAEVPNSVSQPLTGAEIRTIVITLAASLLWLSDSFHHLDPAIPAILAWMCLLAPGIGVMSWREFESGLGWNNFFIIAASMSLASALINSGAGSWLAQLIVGRLPVLSDSPLLVVVVLLLAAPPVRLLIPNITGFLSISIPVAMAIAMLTSLNPVVCGLLVMIAGDAVLYYPAQSASSLVVYERGHLSAAEIFWFGCLMTIVAIIVALFVALPYWNFIGEPLARTV
ncbi:MAG: anion permease [Deltaproteobacteria bacterium]|nr:anion permease [Deltaproteobacteria bacterium]